jgi:hypothetical protein
VPVRICRVPARIWCITPARALWHNLGTSSVDKSFVAADRVARLGPARQDLVLDLRSTVEQREIATRPTSPLLGDPDLAQVYIMSIIDLG